MGPRKTQRTPRTQRVFQELALCWQIMQAQKEKLTVESNNGISVITLNDPPANTYSYEMMRQLDEAILNARMDDSVQVIVITGAGEKFFCAGADIQMLAKVTPLSLIHI